MIILTGQGWRGGVLRPEIGNESLEDSDRETKDKRGEEVKLDVYQQTRAPVKQESKTTTEHRTLS